MRFLIILFFLGILSNRGFAQGKPASHQPSFHSIFSIAVINGKESTSFAVETVQGFSMNKSFAGAGIGIDYYKFRTIPVFLQLRQGFGNGKQNFLVYTNGGANIDWLTDRSKQADFGNVVKYKPGWYYELGLGYRIELKNKNALFLSTGYNYKQVKRNVYYKNCISVGQCVDEVDEYLYSMSRVAVRAAFQF
jgi:hypothetical protein